MKYSIEYGLTVIEGIPQYDLFVNEEFEGFYPSELEAMKSLLELIIRVQYVQHT